VDRTQSNGPGSPYTRGCNRAITGLKVRGGRTSGRRWRVRYPGVGVEHQVGWREPERSNAARRLSSDAAPGVNYHRLRFRYDGWRLYSQWYMPFSEQAPLRLNE